MSSKGVVFTVEKLNDVSVLNNLLKDDVDVLYWDLDCDIMKLPGNLKELWCREVRNIKCELPGGLKVLSANLIKSIGELPDSLRILAVNNLKKLDRVPRDTERLFCNEVKELPKLNDKLKVLHCNNVDVIKELPSGLELLFCNRATSIECELPDSLISLNCDSLIELPNLPDSLRSLSCLSCGKIDKLPMNLSCIHYRYGTDVPLINEDRVMVYRY